MALIFRILILLLKKMEPEKGAEAAAAAEVSVFNTLPSEVRIFKLNFIKQYE